MDAELDLDKTDVLADLLSRPAAGRDRAWSEAFASVVQTAALQLPERDDQRVARGSDGLNYLTMYVPPPDREFRAFSLCQVLDFCLQQGLGIVIDPDKPASSWAFNYGVLWSLKSFGKFSLLPPGVAPRPPGFASVDLAVSAPTERVFPPFAREALRALLKHAAGVDEPRVILVHDPAPRPDSPPAESFVFNAFLEDSPDEPTYRGLANALRWYVPPHLGVMSVAKDSAYAAQMVGF